jgi:hypothetical protein
MLRPVVAVGVHVASTKLQLPQWSRHDDDDDDDDDDDPSQFRI